MQKERPCHHLKPFSPFFFPILMFCLIWIGGMGATLYLFIKTSNEDEQDYQVLMQQTDQDKGFLPSYQAHQQRLNVSKHLFLVENHQRLHFWLQSKHSELVFDQQDHKMEILEHFKGLKCLMQEKFLSLLPNGEEVKVEKSENGDSKFFGSPVLHYYMRHLEAESGTYHYKTKELVGKNVKLFRYLVPGINLIYFAPGLKPLMSGRAKQVNFFLSNENRTFKAQEFEGTLQDIGRSL
jgi:hypothetical protein